MRMPLVTSIVATACLTGIADAQSSAPRAGLAIGDKAPKLTVSKWIKGDPVTSFDADHVYVVEFWATWCSPCIAGMPALSRLQSKYKDSVTILGVTDEPPEKVQHFLRQVSPFDGKVNDHRAKYTLAADPDGSAFRSYMMAAGETGIPTMFIIGRDSHIEWIGHPTYMPPVLERIVEGKWDRTAAKKIRYELEPRLLRAFAAGQWDKALEIIDTIIETDPALAQEFESQKFTILLTETDRSEEAYKLGESLTRRMWDDAQFLNQIAWFVVDHPQVHQRDLDFAQRVADRANELTRRADAMILDTVARVHFEKGDVKTAIEIQKQAVKHLNSAVPPEFHDQIRKTLKKYQTSDRGATVGAGHTVDDQEPR